MKYGQIPWWTLEDSEEATNQMDAWVDRFDTYQTGRAQDLYRWASIYANRDMLSMSRASQDPYTSMMPKQIINRVKADIDTLVGRQVQDESRAVFDVSDGDFEVMTKAEKLERFVSGEMYRMRAYEMCRMALRDAAWAGDGWIHGCIKNKKVHLEDVMPIEMVMDESAGARRGTMRELYRRNWMARSEVIELYPDHEEEIEQLPTSAPPYFWPATNTDMVKFYEGWHLPSQETGKGGRHIVGVGSICIVDEEWTRPSFPFARIKWCSTPIGAYSLSGVEEVLPLSTELDLVTRRIQASIRLFAVPRIWQQAGTKVSAEYNNMLGNVYKYAGMKPEPDPGTPPPPGLYEREQQLLELIDAQFGVSKMELTGDVPSHTDSRPALREVQEIAAGRRDWLSKKFQELCARDVAELIIDTAREIVKKHGSYKAQGRAKQFIDEIDFKDCNLENDRFQISVQPASLLPTTVAGKRMVAGDLMEKGLIQDPNDMWDMLAGMPDVDAMRRLKTASKRLAERQISAIKNGKEYIAPVETQDFALAKKMAQDEINYLHTLENVPDSVFKNMNRFIFECNQFQQLAEPPPAAPQLPVPVAPGAAALGAPQVSPVPAGAPIPAPPPPVQ